MNSQNTTIMNAKLSLTALLVVVAVVVLGGICAEKLNSPKFSKKSALGKRGGGGNIIERRDLADFQTQIKTATNFDISNTTTCPTYPCVGTVNTTLCPAFCAPDEDTFGQIANALISCYVGGFCGKNLSNVQLTNVNISIASGAYDGQCYIYGPQITLTLENQTNSVSSDPPAAAYEINVDMYYVFEGFSLFCRPNLPPPTCTNNGGGGQTGGGQTGGGQTGGSSSGGSGSSSGGGGNCCETDVLTELICLVQQLVGSLGLQLNLLGCDCSCGGSWFGKRQAASSPPAPFQIPITVTQNEDFNMNALYQSGLNNYALAFVEAHTTVTFASTLPTSYADDITNGIQTVFQVYDTFYTLQYNFYDLITDMLIKLTQVTCPKCS